MQLGIFFWICKCSWRHDWLLFTCFCDFYRLNLLLWYRMWSLFLLVKLLTKIWTPTNLIPWRWKRDRGRRNQVEKKEAWIAVKWDVFSVLFPVFGFPWGHWVKESRRVSWPRLWCELITIPLMEMGIVRASLWKLKSDSYSQLSHIINLFVCTTHLLHCCIRHWHRLDVLKQPIVTTHSADSAPSKWTNPLSLYPMLLNLLWINVP